VYAQNQAFFVLHNAFLSLFGPGALSVGPRFVTFLDNLSLVLVNLFLSDPRSTRHGFQDFQESPRPAVMVTPVVQVPVQVV
jgi:hypothetical protein